MLFSTHPPHFPLQIKFSYKLLQVKNSVAYYYSWSVADFVVCVEPATFVGMTK